jgi:inner membrane protein
MFGRLRSMSPLLLKLAVIGSLVLLLLIPLGKVSDLVAERAQKRGEAVARVQSSWGGPQTAAGVLLSVPVMIETVLRERDAYGAEVQRTDKVRVLFYVLPDQLTINAKLSPQYRSVGLYRTPVYLATVQVSGNFTARDLERIRAPRANETVLWNEARLMVLNSEPRSLRALGSFKVADEAVQVEPVAYAGMSGIAARLSAAQARDSATLSFSANLELAGSTQLSLLPLARTAEVLMQSSWPHPKFIGTMAPLEPKIAAQGFSARWSTLEFNRSYGQSWFGEQVLPELTAADAFVNAAVGVEFYEPVDIYQRNYRAAHYAVLVIAVTFLTFFFWESATGHAIHGMQYLFVGLALAVFYVLLLALSEHLEFLWAYLTSSLALVGLITAYLTGVLGRFSAALIAGLGLAALYGTLYLILVSEDYSLLMGAMLLFGVLAAVMLATRRLEWSRVGRSAVSDAE